VTQPPPRDHFASLTPEARAHLSAPFEALLEDGESLHSLECPGMLEGPVVVTTSALEVASHESWWWGHDCEPAGLEAELEFALTTWNAFLPAATGAFTPAALERWEVRIREAAARVTGCGLTPSVDALLEDLGRAVQRTEELVATRGSELLDLYTSVLTFSPVPDHFEAEFLTAVFERDTTHLDDLSAVAASPFLAHFTESLPDLLEHHRTRVRESSGGTALVVLSSLYHVPVLVQEVLALDAWGPAPFACVVPLDLALALASRSCRAAALTPGDTDEVVETALRLALDGLTPDDALEAARVL
jgi:hypothetical protein